MNNQLSEFMGAKVEAQRRYFRSGATLSYEFRCRQLRRLEEALGEWEHPLCEALWQDLHKSREEAVLTELSIVRSEIRNHLRHLRGWMRPRRISSPLKMFPSTTHLHTQPLGILCSCYSTLLWGQSRQDVRQYLKPRPMYHMWLRCWCK